MAIAPWVLPALLSLMLWGVGTFLPKLAVRTLSPLHIGVYASLFFFIGAAAIAALHGFDIGSDPKGILLALLIGIFGTVGQIFYIFAISQGRMSGSAVVAALYPVVTALLAFLILGEKLASRQAAGILLGMCSLVLMVMAGDDAAKE
jgi:transporter family protein